MLNCISLEKHLRQLRNCNLLEEFILKTFNYKIEKDSKVDFYVQIINDDAILYIFERRNENIVNTYELVDDYSDTYLEKSVFKNTVINTIHIRKCVELYDESKVKDNLIYFCKALKSTNPKEPLSKYLDEEVVNILISE